MNKQPLLTAFLFITILFSSCKKDDDDSVTQAAAFSSEVVTKWLDMKARLIGAAGTAQQLVRPGYSDQYINRYFAYLGIALYESVAPGISGYRSLSGQLSNMPSMPTIVKGAEYHWPAAANAALAFMHKGLLYSGTTANKAAIDSLEAALNVQYRTEADVPVLQRSIEFGKAVAKLVHDWSETDGAYATYPPHAQPTGLGLWTPTPPNFAPPTVVHYGDLRTLMPGVLSAVMPPPPPAYSTDPASAFFQMEQEVYQASQTLTAADIAQAQYWRGNSQLWFSILKKVLVDERAMLDKAALAYCKMGIALFDASIAVFKAKYTYNVVRPVTYIRNVMGHRNWNSLFPANANPDYPDGVMADYSASAGAMSTIFGKNYRLNTDGTSPDRAQGYSFNSFEEAAIHGGMSRFLAGVTTKPFVTIGLDIGFKTVTYLEQNIKFKE